MAPVEASMWVSLESLPGSGQWPRVWEVAAQGQGVTIGAVSLAMQPHDMASQTGLSLI